MSDTTIDYLTGGAAVAATAESVSSQLPGRENGPADALRHILIAAELTRKYPDGYSDILLNVKEANGNAGAASAMDYHNNAIGVAIGDYVQEHGGGWEDVVRLAQEVIQSSLSNFSISDVNSLTRASDGNIIIPMTLLLEPGLSVSGISLLSSDKWLKNPDGQSAELSNWPDANGNWLSDFVPELYSYNEHFNQTPIPTDPIDNSYLDFETDFEDWLFGEDDWDFEDDDSWLDGVALSGGGYDLDMDSDYLNGEGYFNVVPSYIATDGWRPGAQETSSFSWLDDFSDFYKPYTDLISPYIDSFLTATYKIFSFSFLNIDPVVLDLNASGIELTPYVNSTIFFDVDNDGFKEQTGWVGANDGILVRDINGNGKIDDIKETLSEFYNGGNYSDGIAANDNEIKLRMVA